MKYTKNPYKRIAIAVAAILLILNFVAVILSREILAILFVMIGAVFGPFWGVVYLIQDGFPLLYLIPFLSAIILMIIGFKCKRHNWGQTTAIVGICLWIYCGILGFGAGA